MKLNKIIKFIFKSLVFFSLLILLLTLYNIGILPLGRLAEGINQKRILSMKLDMSKCEVIEKLGIPLAQHKTYIFSKKGKISPQSIRTVYSYSKPGILWDIEITIHFDKNNKLKDIIMQEGDSNFYVYNAEHLSKIIDLKTYNRVIPNEE
jgi:outer membrane protein assembly factor BamE (lipoprotein component of BamABCDE complex)